MSEQTALHSQAKAVLDGMAAAGSVSLEKAGVIGARALINGIIALQAEPRVRARTREFLIEGEAGLIPLRAYFPHTSGTHRSEPVPIGIFLHGGGWCMGDNTIYDRTCHDIADSTGSIILYVEYRLAPESKYPAPFDDCWRATQWAHAHADELGGNRERLWVLGDSAGGNLAAAVALKARDSRALALALQVLIYPALDPAATGRARSDRDEGSLTRADMQWLWDLYARSKADWQDPYFAPLKARSLAKLAPAYIATAGYDPLRDEGLEYAERLLADGVECHISHHADMNHGFMSMGAVIDRGNELIREIGMHLKEVLARQALGSMGAQPRVDATRDKRREF